MNRRKFNKLLFVFLMFGCGKKESDSSASDAVLGECTSSATVSVTIGSNHGHTLTIPLSDIINETSNTYTTSGGDHSHTLTLSISDIMTIKSDFSICLTSSTEGHSHDMTVGCYTSGTGSTGGGGY